MTTVHRVKRADLVAGLKLSTSERHQIIVMGAPKVFVLDVEDKHFGFDRTVFLPDLLEAGEPVLDVRRTTGIGVLSAALVHAKKHADQGLFISGHTDPSGSVATNLKVSEQRAENTCLLLRGLREEWRLQSNKNSEVDDVQSVLTWQHQRAGWDCRPGPINNHCGPETWGAFSDLYMDELLDLLELDAYTALTERQAALKGPPGMPHFVGCGEHIPFKAERRATFAEGEEGPRGAARAGLFRRSLW